MPTVLRLNGFAFRIFIQDHDPPHVHVYYGRFEAKFRLDPVKVDNAGRMSNKDLTRAERIIVEHRAQLLAAWEEINGNR